MLLPSPRWLLATKREDTSSWVTAMLFSQGLNIETIHDSLPPYHWRFTGLERQKDSNLFVWGGKTWVLSPCLITQLCQEPWPCSQPYIMKGWLHMQLSISVRSPYRFERGVCIILLTVLSNPARTQGKQWESNEMMLLICSKAQLCSFPMGNSAKTRNSIPLSPVPFHHTDGWLLPILGTL